MAFQNFAPFLTRWGTTCGYGHWNGKKSLESYSYKRLCFVSFLTGLQECGQRANGGWPNGQKWRAGVSVQVSGNKREKADNPI
jgi:hypothetical protein